MAPSSQLGSFIKIFLVYSQFGNVCFSLSFHQYITGTKAIFAAQTLLIPCSVSWQSKSSVSSVEKLHWELKKKLQSVRYKNDIA